MSTRYVSSDPILQVAAGPTHAGCTAEGQVRSWVGNAHGARRSTWPPVQVLAQQSAQLCDVGFLDSAPPRGGRTASVLRNPALKVSRAVKREKLLAATEADLDKIKKSVAAGRLKDPDKIGVRVGKAIGKT